MRLAPLLLGSIAVISGCSSLLDFGAYSVATSGGVDAGPDVAAEAAPTKECTKNADCTPQGDFTVCRKADNKCVKLLSPDCPQVLGDWKNDDAVVLGSILPIVGADKAGGIPLLNSISVAMDEFKSGANGLPPAAGATNRRPIAMIACSESSEDPNDDGAPTRSAKHLVDEVQVPAIIGASYSGNTQAVAAVTVPKGVLIMSPTATSVAITDLPDNGLVWRTSPSDIIQAKALVGVMPQIEASTRVRLALGADPVAAPLRVLILNKGDSYGKGLASALQTSLSFNGKSAVDNLTGGTLSVIDYGDPDTATPDYAATLQTINTSLAAAAPHVVFLLGTNEVVGELLVKLEALTWPGGKKPTYLFPDGGLIPELWAAVGTTTDLRKRIFGSAPGTNNAIYQLFKGRYAAAIKDGTTADVGGTAASYDALYLLAYAIAAISDKPLTGANINEGLKRLVPPGTDSQPGLSNINTAFGILSSGKNLDYSGASGPLTFDVVKGEAPSDIQIWCLPTEDKSATGKAAAGTNSGLFFDATLNAMSGPSLSPLSSALQLTCNY